MKDIGKYYEHIRPLIIWLGLFELACLGYWLLGGQSLSFAYKVITAAWIASLIVGMVIIVRVAKRGTFLKYTQKRSNLIGLLSVILISVVFFGSSDVARSGLLQAASQTPEFQLVAIHVLRLLAIGTVIKYLQDELPLHFIILGAVPDLLFAISAVVLLFTDVTASLDENFFIVWHSVGIAAFLGAGISMFFSVPSRMQIYFDKPDTSIVFQFPMAFAPNFTVPLFMLAHMFALTKLIWA